MKYILPLSSIFGQTDEIWKFSFSPVSSLRAQTIQGEEGNGDHGVMPYRDAILQIIKRY